MTNQSPAPLLHPDEQAQAQADFAHMLAHPGQPVFTLGRLRHKNGEWSFVESSCKLLPTGEVLGNYRGVTERERIDQALRAIAEGTAVTTDATFFNSLVE